MPQRADFLLLSSFFIVVSDKARGTRGVPLTPSIAYELSMFRTKFQTIEKNLLKACQQSEKSAHLQFYS